MLCWWSIINYLLSTAMKTLNLKYFGVRILIFRGHVPCDVIGTWPSDSVRALSYWWSMMTMRLSCTDTEIRASKILGSRVWPFGVTWRHRSRDHWTRHMWFPTGGPLEPCIYLALLRRYKASKLHLPMLKAKSSQHMLHVTWPVGRGPKMTTYLEFPSPHCLFTIQLLWGYDDD